MAYNFWTTLKSLYNIYLVHIILDDEMQKEPLSTDGLVDPDVDVEGMKMLFELEGKKRRTVS